MMVFESTTLVAALFLAMIAGTLGSMARNLRERPASQIRPMAASLCVMLSRLLWGGAGLALALIAPHPMTLVGGVILLAALGFHHRNQVREESRALDRWIRVGGGDLGSMPEMLEGFASGCRTGVATRARRLANRLSSGMPLVPAVKRTRLDISADTISRLRRGGPMAIDDVDAMRPGADDPPNLDAGVQWLWERFLYAYTLVAVAWLMGWSIREFVFPWTDELSEEYSLGRLSNGQALTAIEIAEAWSVGVMIVGTIWILAAAGIRWLPTWIARWVPWFGTAWINRKRCEALTAIARGMRAGEDGVALLDAASQTDRSKWTRKHAAHAGRLLADGRSIPDALRQAKWINRSQHAWLSAADQNAHLPGAMAQLAHDIARREPLRWQTAMGWFVPTVMIGVGAFTLVHFWHVMRVLTELIYEGGW